MSRKNAVGIPLISESLRGQLFGDLENLPSKTARDEAKRQLQSFNLSGSNIPTPPTIEFDLPPLEGEDLEKHFNNIAIQRSKPYLDLAEALARTTIPPIPSEFIFKCGWTCYPMDGSEPYSVPYPLEMSIVYDCEVAVTSSNYPVMACAVSSVAWYFWVSPKLVSNGSDTLCPLGKSDKFVVAHYASYDRARTLETYDLKISGVRFWDTLSMHQCVAGLSSKQRPLSIKHNKALDEQGESPFYHDWLEVSSGNSLAETSKLHLGFSISKSDRDYFVTGTLLEIKNRFQQLAQYCATDVKVTFQLYQVLWFRFKEKCPSVVTFCGMLQMGTAILPVTRESWYGYINRCEELFQSERLKVNSHLQMLADDAVAKFINGELDPNSDAWLRHLDWSMPSSRAKKHKDKPEWYRKLFKGDKLNLTVRSQCTPYLLRLSWMGFPLYYHKDRKWGFLATQGADVSSNTSPLLLENFTSPDGGLSYVDTLYYPLPHKAGENSNVGSPLSKDYLSEMEGGILDSDFPEAKLALQSAISCAYWVSVQDRVKNQFVVLSSDNRTGFICPQLITAGTVTGRAVENTWLTAANPKANRIGSEIKTTVRMPQGYVQIGADVDS